MRSPPPLSDKEPSTENLRRQIDMLETHRGVPRGLPRLCPNRAKSVLQVLRLRHPCTQMHIQSRLAGATLKRKKKSTRERYEEQTSSPPASFPPRALAAPCLAAARRMRQAHQVAEQGTLQVQRSGRLNREPSGFNTEAGRTGSPPGSVGPAEPGSFEVQHSRRLSR